MPLINLRISLALVLMVGIATTASSAADTMIGLRFSPGADHRHTVHVLRLVPRDPQVTLRVYSDTLDTTMLVGRSGSAGPLAQDDDSFGLDPVIRLTQLEVEKGDLIVLVSTYRPDEVGEALLHVQGADVAQGVAGDTADVVALLTDVLGASPDKVAAMFEAVEDGWRIRSALLPGALRYRRRVARSSRPRSETSQNSRRHRRQANSPQRRNMSREERRHRRQAERLYSRRDEAEPSSRPGSQTSQNSRRHRRQANSPQRRNMSREERRHRRQAERLYSRRDEAEQSSRPQIPITSDNNDLDRDGLRDFPWPPPEPSTLFEIPRQIVSLLDPKIMGDVADAVIAALGLAGYERKHHRFVDVPGGFAILTRIEQIGEDGVPLTDPRFRWSVEVPPVSFSLVEYLSALAFGRTGYYRVVLILYSDQFERADPERELTEEHANELLVEGNVVIPSAVRRETTTDAHRLWVLVYEFKRHETEMMVTFNDPAHIEDTKHARGIRLSEGLQER